MEPLSGIMSQFMQPVFTGLGEASVNTMAPTITEEAAKAGIDTALTGGLSNVGTTGLGTTFQGLGQNIPQAGMFDSLGSFGKTLGSDQAQNIFKIGGGLWNAYNQGNALNNANNIQQQQLKMVQDAYNRDKTNSENRQKLVF